MYCINRAQHSGQKSADGREEIPYAGLNLVFKFSSNRQKIWILVVQNLCFKNVNELVDNLDQIHRPDSAFKIMSHIDSEPKFT